MSCNKPCGKICNAPEIERSMQWTPIKKLSCNDHTYINSIIEDLEKAKEKRDIERVLAYARELERIKILCGNTTDETVQRLERSIMLARDSLNLQNCKVIKRSLEPNKPASKLTMIGLVEYEIVENSKGQIIGYKTHEKPTKSTPKIPEIEPDYIRLLKANDKARSEALKKKRLVTIDPTQLTFGKKAIERFFT